MEEVLAPPVWPASSVVAAQKVGDVLLAAVQSTDHRFRRTLRYLLLNEGTTFQTDDNVP